MFTWLQEWFMAKVLFTLLGSKIWPTIIFFLVICPSPGCSKKTLPVDQKRQIENALHLKLPASANNCHYAAEAIFVEISTIRVDLAKEDFQKTIAVLPISFSIDDFQYDAELLNEASVSGSHDQNWLRVAQPKAVRIAKKEGSFISQGKPWKRTMHVFFEELHSQITLYVVVIEEPAGS